MEPVGLGGIAESAKLIGDIPDAFDNSKPERVKIDSMVTKVIRESKSYVNGHVLRSRTYEKSESKGGERH